MRYFYRDPLHAAVMAQDFGMKFILEQDGKIYGMPDAGFICHEFMQGKLEGAKFYLTEDSLHLLQPQVGDRWINSQKVCYLVSAAWYGKYQLKRMTSSYERSGVMPKIIQRQGNPFYWPELEND